MPRSFPRLLPAPFLALALLLGPSVALVAQEAPSAPEGLLLSWQRDPLTTMTIDWYSTEASPSAGVQFRPAHGAEPAPAGPGAAGWSSGPTPVSQPFPHLEGAYIHRVELSGLEPGTEYLFTVEGRGRVFRFRTMSRDLSRPLRFATGGDVRHTGEMMDRTNRVALAWDPDFIVWGGDLAYADGRPDRVDRWVEFLEIMRNTLVTPEGRVIPVLASIGNHEVRGAYHHNIESYEPTEAWQREYAPYYYALFAFPGFPGYGALDFGDYLSLILLDTDHSGPVDGAQAQWLDETLAARTGVPHVFPVYHVPAWPSVRNPEGSGHRRVREHWVPLFERHGVQIAFENHDHAYKRTFPLREGRVHPGGVVYVGDGAWGVNTRPIGRSHGSPAWYLDQAHMDRHFIVVTLHGTQRHLVVVNENGEIIDEFPEAPGPPQRR
jgi:hypothetical protein